MKSALGRLGVAALLAFAILAAYGTFHKTGSNEAAAAGTDAQAREVQFEAQYDMSGLFAHLIVMSRTDTPVTVSRVVVNKRYGKLGCDFTAATYDPTGAKFIQIVQLPVQFSYGDAIKFNVAEYCNKPLNVQIYTEYGTVSIDLKYGNY